MLDPGQLFKSNILGKFSEATLTSLVLIRSVFTQFKRCPQTFIICHELEEDYNPFHSPELFYVMFYYFCTVQMTINKHKSSLVKPSCMNVVLV